MTNTSAQASIVSGPSGRPINYRTTLAQIGVPVRMRVGYHDLMVATDYIKFRVLCPPRRKLWVIVKLDRNDTYSVEFGRMKNRFDWFVAAQVSGIYADRLGEVIETLYQEVYS